MLGYKEDETQSLSLRALASGRACGRQRAGGRAVLGEHPAGRLGSQVVVIKGFPLIGETHPWEVGSGSFLEPSYKPS